MNPRILLAYARNGRPLENRNGSPVRLIVPGWYGIANVKWLKRIEVRNRRYMGRFMGRDYVTLRGERQGNEVVFVESSVARMNLKSIIARVTRRPAKTGLIPVKAYGAAWSDGTEIAKVEVKIDGGPLASRTSLTNRPARNTPGCSSRSIWAGCSRASTSWSRGPSTSMAAPSRPKRMTKSP